MTWFLSICSNSISLLLTDIVYYPPDRFRTNLREHAQLMAISGKHYKYLYRTVTLSFCQKKNKTPRNAPRKFTVYSSVARFPNTDIVAHSLSACKFRAGFAPVSFHWLAKDSTTIQMRVACRFGLD